jgi:hypothetical protein
MATDRGLYRFTVKEGDDNQVWLAAEPAGDQLMRLGRRCPRRPRKTGSPSSRDGPWASIEPSLPTPRTGLALARSGHFGYHSTRRG